MIDTHLVAEVALEPLHNLRGERNLGQQIEHPFAGAQCLVNQMDVYFGFTAARNAVKQNGLQSLKLLVNLVERLLLILVQLVDALNAATGVGQKSVFGIFSNA